MAEQDPDNMPSALLEKPEIPLHLEAAWEAFQMLAAGRRYAVGLAGGVFLRISTTEAIRMAELIGWPPLDFLRVIAPADCLYVERVNEKRT